MSGSTNGALPSAGRRWPRRHPSPLLGRYLVRNRLWNLWLRFADAAIALIVPRGESPNVPPPRALLLAVGGQLGDAVIATALLPGLREQFPDARIGVLCGSWSARVFAGHPEIRAVHVADHWKTNRAGGSLLARWIRDRRTTAAAIAELRVAGYDAALDLSPYYPNASLLLWRAKIPVRVGFGSGGFGSLYTHAVEWEPGHHVAGDHLRLAAVLAPQLASVLPERYDLPLSQRSSEVSGSAIAEVQLEPGRYVVIHPGAGAAQKEWNVGSWREVAADLVRAGERVVLTGAGTRQRALCRDIAAGIENVVDASDRLDWDAFRRVIAGARLVISVDTVAMHLAAAAGRPVVAIMAAMDDPRRWRALGRDVGVLTAGVPCAPCYRSRGCDGMYCVRDITPQIVNAAVRGRLRPLPS